jgi:molecular chaperone DnaJ
VSSTQADYYDLLGVGRTASADEVKRAFRTKAREHHPDLNPGDAMAAERFKQLGEAYEVLRDPEKRRLYDRFGHAGVRGAAAGGGTAYTDFGDLGEIFETFFGFGGRNRGGGGKRAMRGEDLRTRVELDFREAVFGTSKSVSVQRYEVCEGCRGTGAAAGTSTVKCAACQGTGEVRRVQQSVFGAFVNVQPCQECQGRGERATQPCTDCSGALRQRRKRTLDVDIPAGVEDGTQIRLTGEADHGVNGGPPGDLYVALSVRDHPVFERHGNDLAVEMWLNPADAALGASVVVPTIDGEATLTVPPATQSGDTFRLEGYGVPFLKRRGRGDQVVVVRVKTPDKLTREQRDLLEQLRATLPEARVANRQGGFWDRVREKLS